MGALSKFIFGGDSGCDSSGVRLFNLEPATLEVGMTEANFSNKNLGAGGAFIISAWITHKDKGGPIVSESCKQHDWLALLS